MLHYMYQRKRTETNVWIESMERTQNRRHGHWHTRDLGAYAEKKIREEALLFASAVCCHDSLKCIDEMEILTTQLETEGSLKPLASLLQDCHVSMDVQPIGEKMKYSALRQELLDTIGVACLQQLFRVHS